MHGKAISFNGVNDHVYILNFPYLDVFSIVFWMNCYRVDDARWQRPIWFGYPAGSPDIRIWSFVISRLQPYPTSFEAYRPDGSMISLTLASSNPLPWTNFAVTFNGVTYRGYRNGIQVASRNDVAPRSDVNPRALRLASRWGADYAWIYLDEVRIYSRALSQEEITFSNTNLGLPPTDGLILWFPLDEGSSAPFRFTIGAKYPLTITSYSLDGSSTTQTIMISCTG